MGRGDKKTRRGKISRGSYGVRRPRKTDKPVVVAKAKKKAAPKAKATPKTKAAPKKKAAPKAKAKDKTTPKAEKE